MIFIGGFLGYYFESALLITIGNAILVIASNLNYSMVLSFTIESLPRK